jgi:hypothetical protein
MVLAALAEGLDVSAASRVFGYPQATITTWLTRAGSHAQKLHKHSFSNLQLPHVQLDELRTRLRCAQQILWLWQAIDSRTKILPVTRARSPHPTHGTSRRSFPATTLGRLSASRCSPVMGSICTSLRSRPILDTGERWLAAGGTYSAGKWQKR